MGAVNLSTCENCQLLSTLTKSTFGDFHKVNMLPIVLALLLQVDAGNDVSPAPRFLDQFSTGFMMEDANMRGAAPECAGLGWIYYNGHCYLFDSVHTPYLAAEEKCNEVGGYLADILDQAESDFVFDGLDTASHHKDGPLDGLLVQVGLLSGDKVRSHDPGLLSSGHLTREDTAKGVEPSLIGGGHHLGHVHHQWGLGVTVLDAHARRVVVGSLVQQLSPVLLGGDGRGQVDDDHLEHGVASGQPVPHHTLHQGLALQLLLLR